MAELASFGVVLVTVGSLTNVAEYTRNASFNVSGPPVVSECSFAPEKPKESLIILESKFTLQCSPSPSVAEGPLRYSVHCMAYGGGHFDGPELYSDFYPATTGIVIPLELCYAYMRVDNLYNYTAIESLGTFKLEYPEITIPPEVMAEMANYGVVLVTVGSLTNVAEYTHNAFFNVSGPPVIRECSFAPEKPTEPLLVFQSKFTLQCSPSPSVAEGPVRCSVHCMTFTNGNDPSDYHELYSDFYPAATGIVIPLELCDAYVSFDNIHNFTSTDYLGKFELEYPDNTIPPDVLAEMGSYGVLLVTVGSLTNVAEYTRNTFFNVSGPPIVSKCSFAPEKPTETLLVFESKFTFQCSPSPVVAEGPVRYSVYCMTFTNGNDPSDYPELYSDFYPAATGIVIPLELCKAFMSCHNIYNFTFTEYLGKFELELPDNTIPPEGLEEMASYGVVLVTVGSLTNVAEYTHNAFFNVSGPPVIRECSFAPEKPTEPLLVFESKFTLQCSPSPSVAEGPVHYSVYCNTSTNDVDFSDSLELYSDFYPAATGIVIPLESCDAYTQLTDMYNFTATESLGKFELEYPEITIPPEVLAEMANYGVVLVTVGSLTNVAQYTHNAFFNVSGPPVISDCSFAPENPTDPLIVFESKFTLQCSPSPSVAEGPVRYSVYCNASTNGSDSSDDPELYADFYPAATGVAVPLELCYAYMNLSNIYNFTATESLGKFELEYPEITIPPEVMSEMANYGVVLVTVGSLTNVAEYTRNAFFNVSGPPVISDCSFFPGNPTDPLIVFESKFTLQCSPSPSVAEGPVRYSVYCNASTNGADSSDGPELYADFYPAASFIVIPLESCNAFTQFGNTYNFTAAKDLGIFELNYPEITIPPEVLTEMASYGVVLVTVGSLTNVAEYTHNAFFNVSGPPVISECSFAPEKPTESLLILESNFTLQCSPSPSVAEGPVRYSVYCNTSTNGPDSSDGPELYSDFYPYVSGILIPQESCDAYTQLGNSYNFTSTEYLGKFELEYPEITIPPELLAEMASYGVVLVTVGSLTKMAEYTRNAFFNVSGPPVISDCSFAPENPTDPLIVFESKFTLQCSPSPSVAEGPVRYSVYCNASTNGSDSSDDPELYSDFYPTATGVVITQESCDAYTQLGNSYNFTSTEYLGKFELEYPEITIPPEVLAEMASYGVVLVTVGSLTNVAEYTRNAFFNVSGPPVIRECSFAPEIATDPLIAVESNFTLQCSPSPSVAEGPVRYSVYCNASTNGSDFSKDPELYADFYPAASGIVIPLESCEVYIKLGNSFNFTARKGLGKFELKSPVEDIPPENSTDPQQVLEMIHSEVDAISSMNMTGPGFTAEKAAVILSKASIRVNKLLVNDTTALTHREASVVLHEIGKQFSNFTYKEHDPVFEVFFRNSSKHILDVASTLMQHQTVQPNVTEEDKANISFVGESIKDTVSSVSSTLLNRTNVGEIINVSTPIIDMKVWRAKQNDTKGKAIHLQNISVELPEGVGDEGVVGMVAVATTINPEPLAFVEHGTNYLNVTFDGVGVDKQDFPVSYSFPRNAPVSDDEDSPYVVLFNLTGEAHCVRYDTAKRLYGWRVVSDSAAMNVEIPASGRAFMTITSNASFYLEDNVHRVDLLVSNKTVGKVCWPVMEEASYSSIKLSRHSTSDGKEELWVENGRSAKTRVGLGFWISYSGLAHVSPPQKCDASLARLGTQVYPVNSSVRLLQMLGQCVQYDVQLRKFVSNKRCKVFPGKDTIRCECKGASLHTAVDPPVTNNIDFSTLTIDLQDNPVPFIFSVSVSCLFLVLCFLGVLQDILSKKKLAPLCDAAKKNQPVIYNVFIYLSKFRCSRAKRNLKFSLTLRGSTGISAMNTYSSPGVLHGAMLHLLHHADQRLGAIRTVKLIPRDKTIRWHVSRVVLSDPLEKELVVFPVNGWIKGEGKPCKRMSEADRNSWRENFLVQVTSDIMEAIPVLMLLLPGRVRERKLDHMLTYALSLMIWALLQLWFYEAVHPLFRPDDCLEDAPSTSQVAVNTVARMLMNMVLMAMASILIERTIKLSLMYKEVKSPESRSWWAGGLLPLPHWMRLVVRSMASLAVVVTIAFLTFMAYMFSKAEFNVWLFNMAEAFAFQILSKTLGKFVTCAGRYLLYLPSPDKFTEDMVNPEGMRVLCPVCHVCPIELHEHFAEHISLPSSVPRPSWLEEQSLFKKLRLFPL